MFEKRKDNDSTLSGEREPKLATTSPSPSPVPSHVPVAHHNVRSTAVIGATITIKGDVTGEENLMIEGKVDGSIDLRGNDLTIGEAGKVSANITANVVKVDGEVTGDIEGVEKVVISRTGRVQGNIVGPRVTLEDGAKFKGRIDMDPTDRVSTQASLPKLPQKAKPGEEAKPVDDASSADPAAATK